VRIISRAAAVLLLSACCLAQGEVAQKPESQPVSADRDAFTFLRYELNLEITPASHGFAARGTVVLRNDSEQPQKLVALQISSSLRWATVRLNGQTLPFQVKRIESDIDHTGAVNEALAEFPEPMQPKGSLELEVGYAGEIPQDARRLTALGMPAKIALASDWDGINADYTALRGVGHVTWYPVAIAPALLSSGNKVFENVGRWKLRNADAMLRANVRVTAKEKRLIASGNAATKEIDGDSPIEVSFPGQMVAPPVIVIASLGENSTTRGTIIFLRGREDAGKAFHESLERLEAPYPAAKGVPAMVVQLPDGWSPYESGATLFTPFTQSNPAEVQSALMHTVEHAAFYSFRPWIYEGVAHLTQLTLMEQRKGRAAALAYLEERRGSLAIAEAGGARNQSLVTASDEVFYRTKAMFVWWMLRDMLGDDALKRALAKYRAEDDKESSYIQRLLEAECKKSLEQFFDDWVYRDKGLPDFSVVSVYPRQLATGGFLVTVTVENSGDAGAEVLVRIPVKDSEQSARLYVPAKGRASARIEVPIPLTRVVVNDGSVPERDVNNNEFTVEGGKQPQ
jgi:hypothetical protein